MDEQELGLDTLSQEQIDLIMQQVKKDKEEANRYYTSDIEPKLLRRKNIVDANIDHYKKKFPKLSELSNWCSQDVKSTIEWIMPSLMEMFYGAQEPVDVQGTMPDDDPAAKKVQSLLKFQIDKKNDGFMFLFWFLKEGLQSNFAATKIYWKREEKRNRMQGMVNTDMMQQLLLEEQAGKVEIIDIQPIVPTSDLFAVQYDEILLKTNQPVLENIPASELRFSPDARRLYDAKYVGHRKIVNGDYLKRKQQEGVYQNVEKALESSSNVKYTQLELKQNPQLKKYRSTQGQDKARKDVELYESYISVDYNGDGLLEKLIVHSVGDTPLRIAANTYEKPPFFVFSSIVEPYKVVADDSLADILEQLQDLKTALTRQVIINVAKNNDPQTFADRGRVDIDAMLDGDAIIGVDGAPRELIYHAPIDQLAPSTFTLIENIQGEIESRTGVTRYNQGLDASSLNKTATGISQIMGAANQRIKLIARIFAETVWLPVVRFLIELNQKFIDQEQIIRLTGDQLRVSPEELSGDFDLNVNVGMGTGSKEVQVQMLMNLIGGLYPTLTQMGIVTPQNWYNIAKTLHENMGLKNINDLLTDPSQVQQMMQQQQQNSVLNQVIRSLPPQILQQLAQIQDPEQFQQMLGQIAQRLPTQIQQQVSAEIQGIPAQQLLTG